MPEIRYRVHGLTLGTAVSLPALDDSCDDCGAVDAVIHLRSAPPWKESPRSPQVELLSRVNYANAVMARSLERVTADSQSWLVQRFHRDMALAFTEAGTEVCLFGSLAQDLDYVSASVAGPIASFLRWQRGWPSLHASSVVVDGHVLALGGSSGAGKSTTVAALACRGYPVFSDDLLGWGITQGRLVASRGPARVKLLPDTLAALGLEFGSLPRVRSTAEKRWWLSPGKVRDDALPFGAVYLLGTPGESRPQPNRAMHGVECFTALKAHCRDDSVLTPAMRARQLETLTELSRRVPVREVRAHGGLDRLEEFVDGIVRDFRGQLAV